MSNIINIEQAEREGARLVLGLGGISGSGKTYSALQLAWGLANGDASKVGLLDTENRRGRLYADILKGKDGAIHKFRIADFVAPFSPERYSQAIEAFVAAGVEVLVIDSVSHEYEGIGGLEDIAHDGNPKNPRWNEAKRRHKSFMNTLLQSPLHVIVCMRAREKVKLQSVNGKTEYVPQGIMPIQEKNFVFELTTSLMMYSGGKSREVIKCPEELVSIFGQPGEFADGYLTAKHGLQLRKWVDGGKSIDQDVARARDGLSMACEGGMASLNAAWAALPKDMQKAIGGKIPDDLQQSAAAFDQHKHASNDNATADDLTDQILGANNG